jgi:hypothetical protein
VAALAAVVVLAACSPGEPAVAGPAATVNGTEIAAATVTDLVAEQLAAEGASPTSVPTDMAAQVLFELILLEILLHEVDERGIEFTREDRDLALERTYAQLGTDPQTGIPDVEQGQVAFLGQPEVVQDLLVDFALASDALTDEADEDSVTDEQVEEIYQERREGQYERRCVEGVILDASPLDAMARAAEVRDALDDGAELADVVESDPADPTAPQVTDFGCLTRVDLVDPEVIDEVFEAEIGSSIGPTDIGGAILVGVVYDEEVDELDDVADGIRAELSQPATAAADEAFGELIVELLGAADVWVDPRFGTWEPVDELGQPLDADEVETVEGPVFYRVVPPVGPEDPPAPEPEPGVEAPGDFDFEDLDFEDFDFEDFDLEELDLEELDLEGQPAGP